MGLRGKGAQPRLTVVETPGQGSLFAEESLAALRRTLPWEEPGLSRLDRVVAFLEDLKVTQGTLAGSKLRLRPWQIDFLRAVYAEDASGRRLVRTAVLSMARKNGKTQLVAGLALCHLMGPEAEQRGEVYAAANDKTQASKTFAEMVAILDEHPELSARTNVIRFSKRIEVLSGAGRGSVFAALSADASTKQGLSPSFTVYDELGTAPKRDLYEALDTAQGARAEPLMVVISTQAASDTAVLSELIDYGAKVNAGEIRDPSFNLTFYGADPKADPWSPATWAQANPALGDFRSLEDVERQAEQARRMPAREQSFRNLILNQRIDAHVRFLAKSEWDRNAAPVDEARLAGRKAWGGLDLSMSRDLTALVWVLPDDRGGLNVAPRFFMPEQGIRDRAEADRTPWDLWGRQGHLRLIPGPIIDPAAVAEVIAEDCRTFDVQVVAYDRWRIEYLRKELARIGAKPPLAEFGQGFKEMAPAVDKLERLVAEGKLRHGGHPLLNMCASNAVIETDPAGNRKLTKAKSGGRIDGLVALAMGLAVTDRQAAPVLPAFLR